MLLNLIKHIFFIVPSHKIENIDSSYTLNTVYVHVTYEKRNCLSSQTVNRSQIFLIALLGLYLPLFLFLFVPARVPLTVGVSLLASRVSLRDLTCLFLSTFIDIQQIVQGD